MTEQTNAELIAEARGLRAQFQGVQLSETQYLEDDALAQLDAVGQIAVLAATRLADRLEAAERDAEGWRISSLEAQAQHARWQEKAEKLAAVAEKAREVLAGLARRYTDNSDAAYFARSIASALDAFPADILRERDAEKWDEGRDALAADMMRPLRDDMTREQTPNPYREKREEPTDD